MGRSVCRARYLVALAACLCLHATVVLAQQSEQSDEIVLEWKQILVQVLNGGPNFTLMVEPEQTGDDLKRDIYEVEGIPDSPMTVKVGDATLNYSMRLSECNIRDETIVTVELGAISRDNKMAEFFVQSLDGRVLQVSTQLGTTVASLKDNITQWAGIPQVEQRLLLNGRELRDERKLLHYKFEDVDEITLNLGRPLEECRQVATILVRTLSSATIEVEVNLADTVTNLKEKIWQKTGVPVGVQRLSTYRRTIAGESRLCDLGLEAGSTVNMCLYSSQITSLDQVARLRDMSKERPPYNPNSAPIFHEAEAVVESSTNRRRVYKDERNWIARDGWPGHRPSLGNDMFDPVAHLSPNPDYDESMQSYEKTLASKGPDVSGNFDRDAVRSTRAWLTLSLSVRPYRQAANLTSADYIEQSPGITLGGGADHVSQKQNVPLGADVNNWAPDRFSDSDVMRLFAVSERVRQMLARAARTGEGLLGIASQRRINRAILFSYYMALVGYPQSSVHDQAREGEECGICHDHLTAEPAILLPCGHGFHVDCIQPWARNLIQAYKCPCCPYCKKAFSLPYEILGNIELETLGLVSDDDV